MSPSPLNPMNTGRYHFDRVHTRVGFVARYAMVTKVRGQFGETAGTADLDGEVHTVSGVQLTIQAAGLSTGHNQRDDHLRSPDFLDVGTYPEIQYRCPDPVDLAGDRCRMDGALSLRGVTLTVPVEFRVAGVGTDPVTGRDMVAMSGSGLFRRSEFGLTWNAALETGGVLVSDEVEVEFEVVLIRCGGGSDCLCEDEARSAIADFPRGRSAVSA